MLNKNRLIIFTKYPTPGRAKTRLIPALGEKKAAELHRSMAEKTVTRAKKIKNMSLQIFFEGADLRAMRDWLGEMAFEKQIQGDLGEKMLDAFDKGFSSKAEKIVLIGTDCPDLKIDIVMQAFLELENKDLVVGPASDGGYYLIGLSKRAPFLFKGISWGSDKVLKQTHEKAFECGVKTAILDTLSDVDRPEDLAIFVSQK